jgi:hypothetical protein
MMLPLRIELAMTFTDWFPNVLGRVLRPTGASPSGKAVSGRNIPIWTGKASILRSNQAFPA